MMKLTWLAWYISGVLALYFVLLSLISYAPGAETFGVWMQSVVGVSALAGAAAAIWLGRFPRDHWIHRSKPVSAALTAAAVTVTVVAIVIG